MIATPEALPQQIQNLGNKARITLIRPPVLELSTNLSSYGAILPIGLAYIAGILKRAGHHVSAIDAPGEAIHRYREVESPIGTLHLNGLTPEEIVERIDPQTEIIGISHMFLHEWPTIREIAERAKAKIPNGIVIVGGENATAFWKHMFETTDAVDFCVLGEGEQTIVELIQRIQTDQSTEIQGVRRHPKFQKQTVTVSSGPSPEPFHYRTYTQKVAAPLPERILEPDTIPPPAWDFFPVAAYLSISDHFGVHRGKSMPMIATRGCPYQCTFCSSPAMWTTRYLTREPREVVEEMKSYVQKYGVDNINFCDLTAIIRKEWILEFCQLLKQENLGISWQLPTGTRSEALDSEVLKMVYETGCRNITYAPESGSERMLNAIKKKVKIPRMLESLRAAHRAKLVTRVNIIIGHPQEKRIDTWKSLWFLIRCALAGCQDTAVMIFAPYPGSEDTENLMREGRVSIDQRYYYIALARSGMSSKTYNPEMGTRELILMQFFMLSVFYSVAYITHPLRIIKFIKSLITGREETQLDQLIRTKLQRKSKSSKVLEWFGHLLGRAGFRST